MMCKIIFTVPMEPSRFASSVVTPQGYKACDLSYTIYIFSHVLPLSPHLLPYN
jgi:hypothetical protein